MRYKALLLDFYGTLAAEDDQIITAILAEIAAHSPISSDTGRIGRDWDFQARCQLSYAENFQTQRAIELESLRLLLERYQVSLDATIISESLFAYWKSPAVYEDAKVFLRNNTLPVCVVSNIDTAYLQAACTQAGWKFDFIVTSEECRSYKPRPEMFLCALEKLGCQAHEVLHVGDSLSSDIRGAQALGIDAAWVNRKQRALPGNIVSPTYTVSSLEELLSV